MVDFCNFIVYNRVINLEGVDFVSSKVIFENNRPELYIDGKKYPPLVFALSDFPGAKSNTTYAHRNVKNFHEQGIDLVCADTSITLGWSKTMGFDPEPLTAELSGVLEANPNAKILLRLHVNPPYWWMKDNMEETVKYDGEYGIDNGEQQRLIAYDHLGHIRVSLASEKWRTEAGECVKAFCEALKGTPEGDALFAVQIACGKNGEWHNWGLEESIPAINAYRRRLKEKFKTVEALREYYGDPEVTFENAEYCLSLKGIKGDGTFREPKSMRKQYESYCSHLLNPTEAIVYFCKVVKESFETPILTGAFYGYLFGQGNGLEGAHMYPDVLFSNRKYIDFLCGPAPYADNRKIDFAPSLRGILESSRLNGVLWLTEMDQAPEGTIDVQFGDPERIDESIAIMRRNILLNLVKGQGAWYYDHRVVPGVSGGERGKKYRGSSIYIKDGWWERPEFLAEIKKHRELAEKLCEKEYKPAADVLLVLDEKARYIQAQCTGNDQRSYFAIAGTKAMFDCIYMGDLEKAELDRYKCVVFMNANNLDENGRKRVWAVAEKCNVLYMYAPGYSDGDTLSAEHIGETVGFNVKRLDNVPEGYVCDGNKFRYPEHKYTSFFEIEDASVEVLATYDGTENAVAARRGNIAYIGSPIYDTELVKKVFKDFKVHIYTEDECFVFAGAGIVFVNKAKAGKVDLTLKNGKVLNLELPDNVTAVFDAETGDRLL